MGSIWTYTVRHWGVEQADRYIDFLTTAFAELADSPKTAPSCEHIRPAALRIGMPALRVVDAFVNCAPHVFEESAKNTWINGGHLVSAVKMKCAVLH